MQYRKRKQKSCSHLANAKHRNVNYLLNLVDAGKLKGQTDEKYNNEMILASCLVIASNRDFSVLFCKFSTTLYLACAHTQRVWRFLYFLFLFVLHLLCYAHDLFASLFSHLSSMCLSNRYQIDFIVVCIAVYAHRFLRWCTQCEWRDCSTEINRKKKNPNYKS